MAPSCPLSTHPAPAGACLRLGVWASLLSLGLSQGVHAQTTPPLRQTGAPAPTVVELPAVQTRAPTLPSPTDPSGFGADPFETPVSASVLDRGSIERWNASRLADLIALEAGASDAYNAPGYWDFLSVRGFTLDNRSNYRREGMPISAETTISLANKERVEILRGTSGVQAGVSAPGGLVNYVVKRPTSEPLREVGMRASGSGTLEASVDFSDRVVGAPGLAWRFNVHAARLRPHIDGLDGRSHSLAAAVDWRPSTQSIVQWEWEWTAQAQASQAAFSVWGTQLPPVPPSRLNLNTQAWSQTSRFEGSTGTLRVEHRLAPDWTVQAQWGRQRLHSDDRMAFPFGCSTEAVYDRFCSDGSFDYYDFRSENEVRISEAANLGLRGIARWGDVSHHIHLGLTRSRLSQHFQDQAFNWVGIGQVPSIVAVPSDPTLAYPSTQRAERTTEWHLQDQIRLSDFTQVWAGVRYSQLERASVGTDGSNPVSYTQSLSSPWIAVSHRLGNGWLLYASTGRGAETQVVPSLPTVFANPGAVLPALSSRQWELGLRGGTAKRGWQVTAFRIERPSTNVDTCQRTGASGCVGGLDGKARHQGLEAAWRHQFGAHQWSASGMWLDATRAGSAADPSLNGRRPVNVPRAIMRAQWLWSPSGLPGASLALRVSHEGSRWVEPDGSTQLPAWRRADLSWQQRILWAGVPVRLDLGIDNLFNRAYWRESPYQFGHIYLYPGASRTARMGISWDLR